MKSHAIHTFSLILLATWLVLPTNAKKAYCFQFTWLGPEYNNESSFGTEDLDCNSVKKGSTHVPCQEPLVITYDGSHPDTYKMLDLYGDQVITELIQGQVCAKYSFYFNGVVQNITYMRAKVFIDGEGAMETGCFTQFVDGRSWEICTCKTLPGADYPCNGASRPFAQTNIPPFIVIVTSLLFFNTHMKKIVL